MPFLAAIDSTGNVLAIRSTARVYTHAILAPGLRWSEDAKGYVPTAPKIQTWCGRPDLAAKAVTNYAGGSIVQVREATAEEVRADRRARAKPRRTIRAILDGREIASLTTQRREFVKAAIIVYRDLGAANVEAGAAELARIEADRATRGWGKSSWTSAEELATSRRESFLGWSRKTRPVVRLDDGTVAVVTFGRGNLDANTPEADTLRIAGYELLRREVSE